MKKQDWQVQSAGVPGKNHLRHADKVVVVGPKRYVYSHTVLGHLS